MTNVDYHRIVCPHCGKFSYSSSSEEYTVRIKQGFSPGAEASVEVDEEGIPHITITNTMTAGNAYIFSGEASDG